MIAINVYKLQHCFVLLSSVLALSVSAIVPIGNWTVIPGPEHWPLQSITVSTNYLWGIDNRTIMGTGAAYYNILYCQRPCNNASSWMNGTGRFDQTIDANEKEVWGVNDRGQIYKRAIDGSNKWLRINQRTESTSFSDVSVANNEYIWAISSQNAYILCRDKVNKDCGNEDPLPVDNELSLVHIEAGDEEVWGVNATNHIFKRPVSDNGSWSIVPGEMRYISASGNAHIWGIAPNNSLYVCAKPCTGDWQYVGGSFKQIDGGNHSVVGVTTDNIIFAMSFEDFAITITDGLAMTTTIAESQVTTTVQPATTLTKLNESQNASSNPPMFSVSTYVAIPVVIGIGIQLLLTGVVIFVLARKLRRKSKLKDNVAVRVKYVPGQSGGLHHLNNPGPEDNANCGFDNQVYSNNVDPKYDSIDDTSVAHITIEQYADGLNKSIPLSKPQNSDRAEDFRNRMDSIPNVYSIHCSINQDAHGVSQSPISPVNSETAENYEYDGSIDNDKLKKGLQKEVTGVTVSDEYEYANEVEFWEPASQEKELKMQVEKLIDVPVINKDALQTHEELGSGQFGTVYRGVWQQTADSEDTGIEVAVKTMEEGAGEEERVKFLQEAAIMGQFKNHPYILRILGIVLDAPYKIVTELMHRGDLHHYLATLRPDPDQPVSNELGPILLSYTRQVALGLMYLSFKKYVHRDIAARNILVNDEGICKIADFGLSRDLFDEDYYVSHGGKVPVKWTAPEAINYRRYSMASDVWSYGCLLYEIWSFGVKPFHDVSNKQAVAKINSGYRLPPPPGCPKTVYQIMVKCWHPTAASRPTPCGIVTGLSHPDFQILKWSQKDIDATSEKARTLGAPLTKGHALYKGLQQKYMPSTTS